MKFSRSLVVLPALLALGTVCAFAQSSYRSPGFTPSTLPSNVLPPELEGVGVEEHLDRTIDLDLTFIAENGYPVKLREYFNKGRPVVLNLIYYNCPQLCSLILNSQVKVMREIPWTPGNEYEIVTISIDPRESFDVAQKKKATYLSSYDRPAPGWHFLTDHEGNAKRLAELVGFHYRYDARQEQYAHTAATMILTPQGKMARYLYGINFKSRDLRFALTEASENRSTLSMEKILLFCYHYDPKANTYVLFATNFMRLGGVLTMLVLGWFLFRMFRSEKMRKERLA